MQIGFAPILIVGIFAIMALVEPRFFTRLNIINVLRNFSFLSIIAVGQMIVMLVGGFDISVGAVMALAAVASAMSMSGLVLISPDISLSIVCLAGIGSGIAVGASVGLVNGLLVTKLKITPFMCTIGTMSILTGLALYITKGVPVGGIPAELVSALGRGVIFHLPSVFWIALAIIALAWWLLEYRPVGRHLYAAGGNPGAARASGIATDKILIGAYVVCSMLAATAGLLMTVRLGSGLPTLGANSAIESIAAAVLGGVSLRGGIGRISQVVMAALFLAILSNALNLLRIDSKWQTAVLGIAVIVAVFAEIKAHKGAQQ